MEPESSSKPDDPLQRQKGELIQTHDAVADEAAQQPVELSSQENPSSSKQVGDEKREGEISSQGSLLKQEAAGSTVNEGDAGVDSDDMFQLDEVNERKYLKSFNRWKVEECSLASAFSYAVPLIRESYELHK